MSDLAPLAATASELSIIRDILKKHLPPTAKVFAFGSRVKSRYGKYSDLDLLIDAGRPLTVDESADMQDDFTECDLPWKVDIIDRYRTQDYFLRIIEPDLVHLFLGSVDKIS